MSRYRALEHGSVCGRERDDGRFGAAAALVTARAARVLVGSGRLAHHDACWLPPAAPSTRHWRCSPRWRCCLDLRTRCSISAPSSRSWRRCRPSCRRTPTALIAREHSVLVSHRNGSLSLGVAISALFTVWSATTGTSSLMTALNLAYDAAERRSTPRVLATAAGMTLLAVIGAVLALALLVALPAAARVASASRRHARADPRRLAAADSWSSWPWCWPRSTGSGRSTNWRAALDPAGTLAATACCGGAALLFTLRRADRAASMRPTARWRPSPASCCGSGSRPSRRWPARS